MTTKSLNRMNNTRQWFPRYLLSNQMIVTRDQVGAQPSVIMAHRSASNHLMGTQTYWKRSTLWLLLSAHATRHQTPLEAPSLNDWRKVLMQCSFCWERERVQFWNESDADLALASCRSPLLTPGNWMWTLWDKVIQWNASDASKTLRLPGSLLASLPYLPPPYATLSWPLLGNYSQSKLS